MFFRLPYSKLLRTAAESVADPGCLSRIPNPDFYPSRIQRGVKKMCCHNFLCSYKFHKIANHFSFGVLKKKIWANFHRIIELFTQKIVTKLSKIWVWDPRSGIRKKHIPDPESRVPDPVSRIQGSKRHRIPDPDPQHWLRSSILFMRLRIRIRVRVQFVPDMIKANKKR